VILIAQIGENIWNYISVRKVVPDVRLSPAHVRIHTLRSLFGYGRHSAVMVIANMFSLQAPATIIGLLLGPAAVALFALPQRLLMYAAEALTKMSDVTSSVTAEFDETRSRDRVWRLAVLTNRTSFTLFLPLAIFLAFYGTAFLRLWVPDVAEQSSVPLRIMLVYFLFAVAGQYNAGAVLLGQARHAAYAWGIVVEVLIIIGSLFVLVPAHGVIGAAWGVTIAVLLVRGVYLAILICRVNGFSLLKYLRGIYARPLAAAFPVTALAVLMRMALSAATWPELVAAGVAIAGAYYSIAFFTVIEPAHRAMIVARIRPRS
jgi:O-antigen/teichoic acid export membrane protein